MHRFEQRMQKRLEQERIHINQLIAVLRRKLRPEELDVPADNTPYSDEADAIQESEEREIQFELLERFSAKAVRVEEALRRIRDGVYGFCSLCDQPVHRGRLEVLPDAACCLECQVLSEGEEVFPDPAPSRWLQAADAFRERSRYF